MKKIFHPYSLAVIVTVISLGILTYVGLTAPTPGDEIAEVKGAIAEPVSYTKLQRIDYGDDLIFQDLSGYIGEEFVDQEQIQFSAYSETSVTYDLYELKNKTNRRLTLRIIPQRADSGILENLLVKLSVNGGEFELYNHSREPNKDYFAISLDPNDSAILRLNVIADKLFSTTEPGFIILQTREM